MISKRTQSWQSAVVPCRPAGFTLYLLLSRLWIVATYSAIARSAVLLLRAAKLAQMTKPGNAARSATAGKKDAAQRRDKFHIKFKNKSVR